jgi:hypothetical protein
LEIINRGPGWISATVKKERRARKTSDPCSKQRCSLLIRTAMIVGNRRTGAVLLVLAMALLLGFIMVVWFNRKKTPTPTPEPPMHRARLAPQERPSLFADRI